MWRKSGARGRHRCGVGLVGGKISLAALQIRRKREKLEAQAQAGVTPIPAKQCSQGDRGPTCKEPDVPERHCPQETESIHLHTWKEEELK